MNHKPIHQERADERPTTRLKAIPGDIEALDEVSEKTDDEGVSPVEVRQVISIENEPYFCTGVPEHH